MPTFPGTVVPSIWFDGNQQAYSDSAGLVPISSGLVRRINEASPLTGVWNAESDADRPLRDSNAIRCELNSGDGGAAMVRAPASGLNANALTLVVSWVHRGQAHGGPQQGLFSEFYVGLVLEGDQISVNTPAGIVGAGTLTLVQGVRHTLSVSYSPTGFYVVLNAGGVITTTTVTMTITSTALGANNWYIGHEGTGGYTYGSFTQAIAVARTIAAGSELDALNAWAHAQPADPAYGTDRPLIAAIGDSITAGTATTPGSIYVYQAQQAARVIGNLAEVVDTAVGGQGVPNFLNAGFPLMRADAFYDATRAKNIAVLFLGSNDIEGANPVQYCVNGVGVIGGNGLYQGAAYLRGRGWKVIGVTILPRSDNTGSTQIAVEAARVALNNELLTNGLSHYDAIVDTTQNALIGMPGCSDNTAYFSADKIHPNNAGHNVLASLVTPVILALLTAPVGQQYNAMRALLRGSLAANSATVANPSDGEVLGFFAQLLAEASGASALPTVQRAAIGYAFRGVLSGNFSGVSNPSDADVSAFWAQLNSDSSGAAPLSTPRYQTLKATLRDAVSLNYPGSANPSLQDILGYFGS